MPDEFESSVKPARSAEPSNLRETVRRRFLRANTAVALMLLIVLALALAAVMQSFRATRNQRQAEQARTEARAELVRAYLSDIRALRKDKTLGRRSSVLETIRRAVAIAPSAELRNEAVASLALPDLQLESSMPYDPAVTSFAADNQLRLCAVGLTNGDVAIRELKNRKEVARLRKVDGRIPAEQGNPLGLAFAPGSRLVSVRYAGGAFAVWDVATGRTLFIHDDDKARSTAAPARFSADGRFVVAPIFAPTNGMAVFETDTERLVAHFPEISSYRHAVMRPGSPMFAANDGTNVVVVNWETRKHEAEFPFAAGVRSLAWSADGRQLAVSGNLLEVYVWDFESRQRRVLTGHKNDVWAVNFDPTGERLATSSFDGTSRIWDWRNSRLLGEAADSSILGWGEGDRVIWERPKVAIDLRQFKSSLVHQESVGPAELSNGRTMDLSPDGDWAVSVAQRQGLLAWDLRSGRAPDFIPLEGVRSFCFHPTEQRLLITKPGGLESREWRIVTNGAQQVFTLETPTPLQAVRNRRLDLITTSTDGRTLACVELAGGQIWVKRMEDTAEPVRIEATGHNSVADQSSSPRGAGTINLSPDGRWLACGAGGSSGANVCDALTGKLVAPLSRHEGAVQFSPDGQWIVVSERTRCSVFRVSNWKQAWQITLNSQQQYPSAAFSPNGTLLAVVKSAKSAALLEAATGRELAELEAPDASPIVTIRWSADGRRLVFATRENHLEVWKPDVLRQELAALGLDWDSKAAQLAPPSPGVMPADIRSDAWLAGGIFATAGLVATIALLALRRHRRLIEDFAQTEALGAQREHELGVEREVNRLKSGFVSMVSHEFRTPLGVIFSSTQILKRYFERLSTQDRAEQLAEIEHSVGRMNELIDGVLLLGKVESGRMECRPGPVDMAEVCRRVIAEVTAATQGVCSIHYGGDEVNTPLSLDERLVSIVLTNLLANAVKYSSAGKSVHLTLRREPKEMVLVVSDQGIGIPTADQTQLFRAFHRAGNVGSVPGTGLGLTIVKRCVDLHGGSISFVSEETKGTTFTIRLPLPGT